MTTTILTTVNSETTCAIACNHKLYGSGTITKIKCSEYLNKPEFFLTFESDNKNTKFAYTVASKLFTLNEADSQTLEELFAEYTENWLEFDANRKAEAEAVAKAKKEAEKQAEAAAKAEQKLKATMASLEKLKPEDISAICGTPKTEYEVIGWLAKHCTNIKPSMPAEALSWFEQKFGKVDNAKVYEAGAKTTGNNPMKYTLSIAGNFNAEVPAILNRFASGSKLKHISSVEFFWTLIDKYGFQFGKKQNIDEIRKFVPTCYISDFEQGLVM